MNKETLVKLIAEQSGQSQKDAKAFLDAAIDVITDALNKGDKVTLIGFGTFQVKERAAREGRNPKTGRPLKLPAKKSPVFTAGQGLKDAVAGTTSKSHIRNGSVIEDKSSEFEALNPASKRDYNSSSSFLKEKDEPGLHLSRIFNSIDWGIWGNTLKFLREESEISKDIIIQNLNISPKELNSLEDGSFQDQNLYLKVLEELGSKFDEAHQISLNYSKQDKKTQELLNLALNTIDVLNNVIKESDNDARDT